MKPLNISFIFVCCALAISTHAQIEHPRISPSATLTQKVGLSEVKIEYSRPGVRGRKIVGDLIPYGRIWRVGANESTKIYFSDSVNIANKYLPPGTYAIYAIPFETAWTIIIHKNTTHWGDGRTNYNPQEDALRFSVQSISTNDFTETFTIELSDITHEKALVSWKWEQIKIQFLIQFDTRKKMIQEIRSKITTKPTADTFYESARFLQEENIFLDDARTYLMKAQQMVGDKYYIHRIWALVESQLGNYKDAIHHAQLSKELAAREGKDEFVRMNEKSIQEWTSLIKKVK